MTIGDLNQKYGPRLDPIGWREILEKHLLRCRELAECAGDVQKCFPDKFEKLYFSSFLKFFIIFWYPGRSSGGSGDSLGIENNKKNMF